ncbi:hypothetical protein NL676_034929 [Syzygium grande]|nr:hypothetical protein NL676_034929 [Syzygium grande]
MVRRKKGPAPPVGASDQRQQSITPQLQRPLDEEDPLAPQSTTVRAPEVYMRGEGSVRPAHASSSTHGLSLTAGVNVPMTTSTGVPGTVSDGDLDWNHGGMELLAPALHPDNALNPLAEPPLVPPTELVLAPLTEPILDSPVEPFIGSPPPQATWSS